MTLIFIIIIGSIFTIDIYTFKGITILFSKRNNKLLKQIVYITFWVTSVIMMSLIIVGGLFRMSTRDASILSVYAYFFGLFLVFYVPKIIFILFHFFEDLIHILKYVYSKIYKRKEIEKLPESNTISRSKFLSQTGIAIASIPFMSLIYGMVHGRFDFRIEPVRLKLPNLPKSFNGLRIIQLSDIHIGSFSGYTEQVQKAIQLINEQNADIVVFTGDLVNNFAEEMNGWLDILSNIKARIGKYSILGNHDYGNYYHWDTPKEKVDNFELFKSFHAKIGWHLLENDSVTFTSKSGEKIALIGVENWGHAPFPQLADFEKAEKKVQDIPFKILLSHDPTHWDAKILGKKNVTLTLSGHTHGMQFGVNIGDLKWSPAQYKYRHWAGLYTENNQHLYVNRGFGYIGYPGRVGMTPEITVIDLMS